MSRLVGWGALLLFLLGGLTADVARAQGAGPPGAGREWGVVFVAPGAGDVRIVERSMRAAVAQARLPLRVVCVDWSHGQGLYYSDIRDQARHHAVGQVLAQRVLEYRKANPGGKVFLISHSAGSAVLLAATAYLPPDSVDRMVLLASGGSSRYDVRPALRVCRQGIDLFYSETDGLLDFAAEVFGTTEGRGGEIAGQVGFARVGQAPTDRQLYQRLHQHPWRPEYAAVGYYGGHFSLARTTFLYHVVLPLLLAS